MEIYLDLTEKECGYLIAAVSELYHKMRAAEEAGPLVVDLSERIQVAKTLWRKIEEKVKIDG